MLRPRSACELAGTTWAAGSARTPRCTISESLLPGRRSPVEDRLPALNPGGGSRRGLRNDRRLVNRSRTGLRHHHAACRWLGWRLNSGWLLGRGCRCGRNRRNRGRRLYRGSVSRGHVRLRDGCSRCLRFRNRRCCGGWHFGSGGFFNCTRLLFTCWGCRGWLDGNSRRRWGHHNNSADGGGRARRRLGNNSSRRRTACNRRRRRWRRNNGRRGTRLRNDLSRLWSCGRRGGWLRAGNCGGRSGGRCCVCGGRSRLLLCRLHRHSDMSSPFFLFVFLCEDSLQHVARFGDV